MKEILGEANQSRLKSFAYNALITIFALFTYLNFAGAQLRDIPTLRARVTDQTGSFSPSQISQLERMLGSLESEKGAQLAVLIVPSTAPEAIEAFSLRVVEHNKLGRKKIDDGVLLLVAKDDRAARIEVGYALEGAIPDAFAKRILEDQIFPHFRAGEFFEGVQAGVIAIASLIRGEQLPPPYRSSGRSGGQLPSSVLLLGFLSVAVGASFRQRFGRIVSGLIGGSLCFVIGLVLSGLGLAIFFLLIGFILSAFAEAGGRGYRGYGGWGSGGGFSGGGWSGGGGSFGGGGASGRW